MDNKPSSTAQALRRLLIVIGIAVGVFIYAYGWRVTDISLEETNDPVRQESVTRALRELLSPDIFDQNRESMFAEVPVLLGCEDGDAPVQAADPGDGSPYVVLTPTCAAAGEIIAVEGFNFPARADAFIRWIPPTGQSRPLVRKDIDDVGYFSTEIEVPRIRGGSGELHTLEVEGSWPVGLPFLSDTSHTVIEKIIETIFLALMATTIAVPIAAALSFLAARNLMRQVHMPVGDALVAFILLPVGWWLGNTLLGPVQRAALDQTPLIALLFSGLLVIGYALLARVLASRELPFGSLVYHARRILLNLAMLVVAVFVVGTLGRLGLWIADALQVQLLADLGNFVGTLGELILLTVTLLTGAAGAFFVSSLGMEATRGLWRRLPLLSSVLGLALGALAGAVLFIGLAGMANLAALMGLFPPIIAAVLGMQIAAMLYNRLTGAGGLNDSPSHQSARLVFGAVAAVVVFGLVYVYLDTSRGFVDGRLPAAVTWNVLGQAVQAYMGKSALIGLLLGGLGGLLAGARGTFPLGMTLYTTSRTILNAIRAIEPLIMGIVFVIWVGVGPFAGVLALTLHSIAALGKLYSEQVENIDEGPLEAIQATGANRLQTIIYGVVPQIVPPYIAFTMYRWDINVRMSTIIGFVGGGGIGFLLQQQINLLRYRDAGVAVLAIAIVVSVLDYTSAWIRERVV